MSRKSEMMEIRLKKILEFLVSYNERYGYPPTIREIGKHINVNSTSQVSYYLAKLEEKKAIDRSGRISRGYKVLSSESKNQEELRYVNDESNNKEGIISKISKAAEALWSIPLMGRVVASEPLPMPDDPRYDPDSTIEVARSLFGINENPSNLFALEVDGDSMIDAMINDGDIVIFRRQESVNNGEMAAIWIDDDNSTTLKYFFDERDFCRLKPANPTMDDILVPKSKHLRIMGKVVAVMRQVSSAA